MASVSGLSAAHRNAAKHAVVQAAYLGLHHAPELHYTQGARRWEGIDKKLVAARGQYPRYADCSAFATWCLWNGLYVLYGCSDVVNGQRWQAGYTGTQHEHGKRVVHEKNRQWGDLALYGDPYGSTGHVAVYVGGGKVISHGSEGGPYYLPINYRADLREVRRYI